MRSRLAAITLTGALAVSPLLAAGPIAQEPEEQGVATAGGAFIEVRADSWAGWPIELTEVIPLLVTVENRGSAPIRLRFQEFTLATAGGAERAALPPYAIRGVETEAVGTTGVASGPYPFTHRHFYVAPHLERFYPTLPRFYGAFSHDPAFYATHYPVLARVPLPSGDMVAKALPEGVLEPGGAVSGFLYFEGFEAPGAMERFEMDVVHADSGALLGSAQVTLEID